MNAIQLSPKDSYGPPRLAYSSDESLNTRTTNVLDEISRQPLTRTSLQARGDGQHGQRQVPGVQRREPNAGVPREQLEHRAPPLTVEPAPDMTKGPAGIVGSPQRSKRERKTCQPEVQGTVLKVLGRRNARPANPKYRELS